MHNKKIMMAQVLGILIFCDIQANAAEINPVFATPAEKNRQEQLEAQERLRQQERERLLRQQQEIKPDVRDDAKALSNIPAASDVIPDHETPCFVIHKIELVGDSAEKFQFALEDVLKRGRNPDSKAENIPILDSCLGVEGINAIMVRIQNFLIAKGYITTRVLVAPQNLNSGVLQYTIVPGRLGEIKFTSDSSRFTSRWNAFPMNSGDILNLRDIEQALENLKRIPSADADIQIRARAVAGLSEETVDTYYTGLSANSYIRLTVRYPYVPSRYPKNKERSEWIRQSSSFIAQALSSIRISPPAGSTEPDFLVVDESQNSPIEMLAP